MVTAINNPSLAVEDVTVVRGGVMVLDEVSFAAGPNSLMGVVGPNGAGKSTLFNVIVSLLPPTEGRVLVHGQPLAEARHLVAYVPQHERVNWRLPMSVMEVTLLGRTRRVGWFRSPGRADREAAEEALRQVDMFDRRHSLIGELSGGQQQRVFVARALAQGADVLLLDEALSGVDIGAQESLLSLLTKLRDQGRTIMMSSHDVSHMAQHCDQCLCLNGHVCAFGPPAEVLTEETLLELYGHFNTLPAHGHGILASEHGHGHAHDPSPGGQERQHGRHH